MSFEGLKVRVGADIGGTHIDSYLTPAFSGYDCLRIM